MKKNYGLLIYDFSMGILGANVLLVCFCEQSMNAWKPLLEGSVMLNLL